MQRSISVLWQDVLEGFSDTPGMPAFATGAGDLMTCEAVDMIDWRGRVGGQAKPGEIPDRHDNELNDGAAS